MATGGAYHREGGMGTVPTEKFTTERTDCIFLAEMKKYFLHLQLATKRQVNTMYIVKKEKKGCVVTYVLKIFIVRYQQHSYKEDKLMQRFWFRFCSMLLVMIMVINMLPM